MEKPTPKREVAISHHTKMYGTISFYSSSDAVTEFETFGSIYRAIPDSQNVNLYRLFVDSRFDFDEVLAYIENYG
jgi:hypothetical protein